VLSVSTYATKWRPTKKRGRRKTRKIEKRDKEWPETVILCLRKSGLDVLPRREKRDIQGLDVLPQREKKNIQGLDVLPQREKGDI